MWTNIIKMHQVPLKGEPIYKPVTYNAFISAWHPMKVFFSTWSLSAVLKQITLHSLIHRPTVRSLLTKQRNHEGQTGTHKECREIFCCAHCLVLIFITLIMWDRFRIINNWLSFIHITMSNIVGRQKTATTHQKDFSYGRKKWWAGMNV